MKIVWIEDEQIMLRECSEFLRQESIEVCGASTLEEGERLIDKVKPNLLLVDWMLPNSASGIEICKLNEQRWRLPFIMVTAKGDEFDKVLALELGADDYLTKPFSLRELSARIKAVMRRSSRSEGAGSSAAESEESMIRRGKLTLDYVRFHAELDGRKLDLTKTEFLLLWKLASYPGRVFTRAQLMDEALGFGYLGYERTMDSHIRNLRRKLEENVISASNDDGNRSVGSGEVVNGSRSSNHNNNNGISSSHSTGHMYVETVYGVGYRFAEEV